MCNFGALSPLDFFKFFSSGFFPFSPGLLCNLVRTSPQNVEKIARCPGGEKSVESCHVCGCHGFSGPEFTKDENSQGLIFVMILIGGMCAQSEESKLLEGQLYGESDLNTQEWTDGVLAIAVREAAKAPELSTKSEECSDLF